MASRRAHNPEVVGSNPAPASKNLQLVGLAGELFSFRVLRVYYPGTTIGSLIGRENRSLAILARKKVVVGVRADNAPQGAGEPHRFDRDPLHRLSCIRQNRGI